MNVLYICVIIVLLFCLAGGLYRVLVGPDNSNRMLASQLFGTIGVTIVVLLAFLQANELLINLALVIALLASITVVAFLKLAEHAIPSSKNTDNN
tara:strand:+ start:2793 stop:3077 length:285 start_codon:yes stop_codon:yes gene_type:complete